VTAVANSEYDLAPARVAELLAEGWPVIDVREPHEREAGHIAGTRHIELGDLTARAGTLDQAEPLIFYCRVGARSAMATQAFRASGFEAYHLTGGIMAWVQAGLELKPADGHVAAH
jgi:rhodanese-related sulfurtransferase